MKRGRIHTFVTIIGRVSVVSDGSAITAVYLPNQNLPAMTKGTDTVTDKAEEEISGYLAGKRKDFDVPVSVEGTDFTLTVLDKMSRIPYGSTITYGELAEKAGHPRAARAVGTVCSRNPIPLIIPCHRVVAFSGVGQYGGGVALKKRLLAIERKFR